MFSLAAHHTGTVALLRALGRDAPLELLGDPEAFIEEEGLKYDVYATTSGAWGFTVNARGEGDRARERFERYAAGLGGYDWRRIAPFWARFGGVLTLGVGFDRPGAPPRLKLYAQEDQWGAGVCGRARVEEWAGPLPDWLGERIDVVTLQLHAGGDVSWKVYVGAETAEACARGAPPEVQATARRVAAASPSAGWHYLTVRQGGRYAINKIYPGKVWTEPGSVAWRDVAGLFREAGAEPRLEAILRAVRGLRVRPTATALEGEEADVYVAAVGPGLETGVGRSRS